MPLTASTFERVALEEDDQTWELYRGRLREKPGMSYTHNDTGFELAFRVAVQLEGQPYTVRSNAGYVRYMASQYFVPDVMIIPEEYTEGLRGRSDVLECYDRPLPLVVEVWSPSTGDYDVETKFPIYRDRGDVEIWRLHPYERTLTRWVRRMDGGYVEDLLTGGEVRPVALPGVVIDLDGLFAVIDG